MREVRKPSLGLNSARIPLAVAAPVGGSPNCEMGCRAFGTLGLRCANPSPIRTPPRLRFATAPPVGGMSKKKVKVDGNVRLDIQLKCYYF